MHRAAFTRSDSIRPAHLFKYYAVSDYSVSGLRGREVFYSAPSKFNDPFDCRLQFADERILVADLRRLIHSEVSIKQGTQKANEVAMNLNPQLQKLPQAEIRSSLQAALRHQFENRGVCCFSEVCDNLLMWGHYANGHRGFCLEFDTSYPLFYRVHPVTYSANLPLVSVRESIYDDGLEPMFRAAVLTKSVDWSYEKEWRVLHEAADTVFHYGVGAFKAVYFGAAIAAADREKLVAALQGTSTPMFQMRLSDTGYSVYPDAAS